uniref:Uncharacterized protein n=1 Tax=Seriola lalandi dorsalis TaxID=1841481 RepID=A0A3B4YGL3_SERLL
MKVNEEEEEGKSVRSEKQKCFRCQSWPEASSDSSDCGGENIPAEKKNPQLCWTDESLFFWSVDNFVTNIKPRSQKPIGKEEIRRKREGEEGEEEVQSRSRSRSRSLWSDPALTG